MTHLVLIAVHVAIPLTVLVGGMWLRHRWLHSSNTNTSRGN